MYNKKDTTLQSPKNSSASKKEPEILVNEFWEALKQLQSQTELFGYNRTTTAALKK